MSLNIFPIMIFNAFIVLHYLAVLHFIKKFFTAKPLG